MNFIYNIKMLFYIAFFTYRIEILYYKTNSQNIVSYNVIYRSYINLSHFESYEFTHF